MIWLSCPSARRIYIEQEIQRASSLVQNDSTENSSKLKIGVKFAALISEASGMCAGSVPNQPKLNNNDKVDDRHFSFDQSHCQSPKNGDVSAMLKYKDELIEWHEEKERAMMAHIQKLTDQIKLLVSASKASADPKNRFNVIPLGPPSEYDVNGNAVEIIPVRMVQGGDLHLVVPRNQSGPPTGYLTRSVGTSSSSEPSSKN